MAKCWLYKYGEDIIKVVNKDFGGSELYINDELCDQKKGVSLRDCLSATLKNGETVSAVLEGVVTVGCSLCVDGKSQDPVQVK